MTQTRARVNVRLPPALVKWAKKIAKDRKISFTRVVELALLDAMQSDQATLFWAKKILKSQKEKASANA